MKASRLLVLVIGLVCIAALSAAWVSQHLFGMQPCPWCVLQRAIFGLIAIQAFVAWWLVKRPWGLSAVSLVGLVTAFAGAKAAHWQHFVATQQSCVMTLADRIISFFHLDTLWPGMFSATASCADAAVRLLGLPYEFWSLGLFLVLALAWVLMIPLAWRSRSAS